MTGSKDNKLSGDISFSTFTLTGDDGTAKHYGLKTVKAAGIASLSNFIVEAGNVDSVMVGRFFSSKLYLNYRAVLSWFGVKR